MKKHLGLIGIFLICLIFVSGTSTNIRIVAYNCANHPNNTSEENDFHTIFEAIGNESINGNTKRLDILVVSEMDNNSANNLVTVLNNLYNVDTYRSVLSSSIGGDRTGVIYDTSTIALLDSTNLKTIGTHPILKAKLSPFGSTAVNEQFYVYAIHLKFGSGGTDITQRATEVTNLRKDADALGEGIPIIYAGDFNMTSSSEGAWTNLLTAGNGQAVDAANTPGDWRDNHEFIHLHSQDPRYAMNDRFDFIFISGEFSDGHGIEYITDSFRVFGNNGTHALHSPITTGTGVDPNVLAALENVSDHLPVFCDFEFISPDKPASPQGLKIPHIE